MQLNHPDLTPAELGHLRGMIAEGAGDYARRHGPFRAAVIGAFMAEACNHFNTRFGPPKPAKQNIPPLGSRQEWIWNDNADIHKGGYWYPIIWHNPDCIDVRDRW